MAGLVVASVGVTAPGRELLRAATALWPGLAVLRDGQQFVAPLALAEALGAGLVVAWAASPSPLRATTAQRDSDGRQAGGVRADRPGLAIAVALLLAPVLLLPGLAWGAAGRLRPVWYPADWLAAARVIDGSRAPGQVLLLPWAAYRRPAWNGGRTVLDPWPRLLSRPVIWNTGPRVGNLQLKPDDPAGRSLRVVQRGLAVAHRLARPALAVVDVAEPVLGAGERVLVAGAARQPRGALEQHEAARDVERVEHAGLAEFLGDRAPAQLRLARQRGQRIERVQRGDVLVGARSSAIAPSALSPAASANRAALSATPAAS